MLKRPFDAVSSDEPDAVTALPDSLTSEFSAAAKLLDARNEQRESIFKLSRDITIASKKLIFSLHRISSADAVTKVAVRREFNAVHLLISKMLTRNTTDYFRFSGTFSSGLQEYIEAISYWKFLCDGSLISKAQIEAEICADSNVQIQIPLIDYLLGICDLSGELMRFAINTVSAGDRVTVFSVCHFVRDLQTAFIALQLPHRDYSQKADTMLASIMKIEKICYKVAVRGTKFSSSMVLADDARPVAAD